MSRIRLAALVFCLTAACSSPPSKKNEQAAGAESDEKVYNLPEVGPTGQLRIHYYGVETYQSGLDQPKTKAVHLGIVARNDAPIGDWVLNSEDLALSFPGGAQTHPIAANPRILQVKPDSLRGMDLYFPLPKELATSDRIPEMDLHWRLQTLEQNYSETSTFNHIQVTRRENSAYSNWSLPYDFVGGAIFGEEYGWLG